MATQKQRTVFNREPLSHKKGSRDNWVNAWNATCYEYGLRDLLIVSTPHGKMKIVTEATPAERKALGVA